MTPRPLHHPRRHTSLAVGLLIGLCSGAAVAGPGTQTEDDVYVGKRRQANGTASSLPAVAVPKALLPGTPATTGASARRDDAQRCATVVTARLDHCRDARLTAGVFRPPGLVSVGMPATAAFIWRS